MKKLMSHNVFKHMNIFSYMCLCQNWPFTCAFPFGTPVPQTQHGKNGTAQFRLGAMHQIDHAFVHDCDEIYGVAMPKDLSPDADQSATLLITRSWFLVHKKNHGPNHLPPKKQDKIWHSTF